MCVRSPLDGKQFECEIQAEKIDRIETGEASFVEAFDAEFASAGSSVVVVTEYEAREQNEEADGSVAGVHHWSKWAKPVRIGEVKEDDVDGCETAEPGEGIKPCWLLHLHWLIRRSFVVAQGSSRSNRMLHKPIRPRAKATVICWSLERSKRSPANRPSRLVRRDEYCRAGSC